jgi:phosphonate transport system substrate-binding protein
VTQSARKERIIIYSAFLVLLVTGAITVSICYYMWTLRPVEDLLNSRQRTAAQMAGLSDIRISHHLDPQFTDENGSLVADPPKDPAKLADPDTLVFSWIGEDDYEFSPSDFKDLTDCLAKATGKHVVCDLSLTDTEDQLHALSNGKLHITVFSTGSVPKAVNTTGFIPVGMLAGSKGQEKYRMLIIVPTASPITDLDGLRGHELVLTSPSSNSGFKAPIVLLKNEHNLVYEKDYHIRFSQNFENSITGISNGQYEAAAVASDVLDRQVASNVIKKDSYRVIYTSADFPRAAIGYVYNLKPELAAKVKDALLTFDFKGTALEPRFTPFNVDHFAALNYFNDWALVRMIDDTIAGPQEIK